MGKDSLLCRIRNWPGLKAKCEVKWTDAEREAARPNLLIAQNQHVSWLLCLGCSFFESLPFLSVQKLFLLTFRPLPVSLLFTSLELLTIQFTAWFASCVCVFVNVSRCSSHGIPLPISVSQAPIFSMESFLLKHFADKFR